MKRTLIAGLVGGIAMFCWSGLAHNILPLGTVGVQEIPNEGPVLSAMHDAMGSASGLYLFPGSGAGPNATTQQKREAMQNYQAKLNSNPSGLLVYYPAGARVLSGKLLVTEFLTELIESFLLVFLLTQTRLITFSSRMLFVLAVGMVAAIATNIPYWNWYGFPTNYTVTYMFTVIVAYLVAGAVALLILGRGPGAVRTTTA